MSVSVQEIDGEFHIIVEHLRYNGGGPIRVTGHSTLDGAEGGALWWSDYLESENPPTELVCITGARYDRV